MTLFLTTFPLYGGGLLIFQTDERNSNNSLRLIDAEIKGHW